MIDLFLCCCTLPCAAHSPKVTWQAHKRSLKRFHNPAAARTPRGEEASAILFHCGRCALGSGWPFCFSRGHAQAGGPQVIVCVCHLLCAVSLSLLLVTHTYTYTHASSLSSLTNIITSAYFFRRFMQQITSSAIGNAPPPAFVVKKVKQSSGFSKKLDANTKEAMDNAFGSGKRVRASRNWCSVSAEEQEGVPSLSFNVSVVFEGSIASNAEVLAFHMCVYCLS